MELRDRFNEETMAMVKGFYAIPSVMCNSQNWKGNVKSFMLKYSVDMPDLNVMDAEIDLWENFWLSNNHQKLPETVEETISLIPKSIYPNMLQILKLLAVVPVTTCTCKRSISTLRRVKSYLRNSMNQV